jgi:aryl sulfotransferase
LVAIKRIGSDPQRIRHIHNHHFDSRRWDQVALRDNDITIASPYKSGTTWLQAIVAHLVFDGELPAPLADLSPWLEANYHDLAMLAQALDQQRHRRFIKSHLPLDALPWDPRRRFLYIARDGRDVAMSLWNHYFNWNDKAHALVNQLPNERGETFPLPPADVQTFFDSWLHKGWLAWERDGWPYWSFFHNVQTWWDHHHHLNILLLHYSDLLADLPAQIARIATFLGIEIDAPRLATVVAAVNIDAMRLHSNLYVPCGGVLWQGGAATFLYRGSNGRWRGVLSAEQLEAYDRVSREALSPACHAWLHGGHSATELSFDHC